MKQLIFLPRYLIFLFQFCLDKQFPHLQEVSGHIISKQDAATKRTIFRYSLKLDNFPKELTIDQKMYAQVNPKQHVLVQFHARTKVVTQWEVL